MEEITTSSALQLALYANIHKLFLDFTIYRLCKDFEVHSTSINGPRQNIVYYRGLKIYSTYDICIFNNSRDEVDKKTDEYFPIIDFWGTQDSISQWVSEISKICEGYVEAKKELFLCEMNLKKLILSNRLIE